MIYLYRHLTLGLFLLWVGVSWGCGPSLDHRFADNRWLWKDTLRLTFTNDQAGALYLPILKAEMDHSYDFKNLYVKYEIISPKQDTLIGIRNFLLSDSIGNWLTEERPGKGRYYFELPLTPPGKLAYTGSYRLTVLQYMRTDTLIGIRQAEPAFKRITQ